MIWLRKVKHYRPYMISKCSKSLRILDFTRIKDGTRTIASIDKMYCLTWTSAAKRCIVTVMARVGTDYY